MSRMNRFAKCSPCAGRVLRRWVGVLGYFGCIAAALSAGAVTAGTSDQNVDLSTVPTRESVELTIYNSEDLTLVRERRRLSLARGANRLQFSWANTLIDPSSVDLRVLPVRGPGQGQGGASRADAGAPSTPMPRIEAALEHEVVLVDTTYPHDKPQMLYWRLDSAGDQDVMVEITYFTSGLSWDADYTLVATEDQSKARMEGFVRVHNRSGEDYEGASVRVVVGTINLVEKIAQLARVGIEEVKKMAHGQRNRLHRMAAREALAAPSGAMMTADLAAPKAIAKEGLSEYFIFSIEGTETIANGWSKRLRSFEAEQVPVTVRHRYRPEEYGTSLVRLYLLRNDEDSNLGGAPLPGGNIRVFRALGDGGLALQGRQKIDYVPVGDEIEVNLGPVPDIVFERRILRQWRDEIWMRQHDSQRLRPAGQRRTVLQARAEVVGWTEHTRFAQRIRNFTSVPIVVDVRERFEGHAEFASELDPSRHDFRSVEYTVHIAAGKTHDALYEVAVKQGRNAQQRRVEIVTRPVKRGVPGV